MGDYYEKNSVLFTYNPAGLDSVTQDMRYGTELKKIEKEIREKNRGVKRESGHVLLSDGVFNDWRSKYADRYDWITRTIVSGFNRSVEEMEGPIVKNVFDVVTDREKRMSEYASSLPRVHPPSYGLDVLVSPSIQALDTIQQSVLQRQGYHVHLNALYRIARVLGMGVHGTVYGMAMRTPEVDNSILDILTQYDISESSEGVEVLLEYLRDLPKWVALKTTDETSRDDILREYIIGREISLALLPLGIRASPTYYSMFTQARVDIREFIPSLEYDEDEDEYRSRLNLLYTVLGRPAKQASEEILLYQEYIRGKTYDSLQRDAVDEDGNEFNIIDAEDVIIASITEDDEGNVIADEREMREAKDYARAKVAERVKSYKLSDGDDNVTFCYLHSILSYLYKSLGYVHGDLHSGNILMMEEDCILPIIDEDGRILTHLFSHYRPYLIDHGSAKINKVIITGEFTSNQSSQIIDIAYMNRGANHRRGGRHLISHDIVTRYLTPIDVDIDKVPFIPPIITFNVEGTLTHSLIVQEILSSGVVDEYKRDLGETILNSTLSLYSVEDKSDYAKIVIKAKGVMNKYPLNAGVGEEVIRQAVRAYLNETVAYYTHDERMKQEKEDPLSSFFSGLKI